MSKLHDLLMDKVSDGNLQSKMEGIPYSTTLREIVTVGDMEEHYQETEGELSELKDIKHYYNTFEATLC